MFRIFSELLVIFRHFSEYLAQKLVYSESLDFVVLYCLIRLKLVTNNENVNIFFLQVIQKTCTDKLSETTYNLSGHVLIVDISNLTTNQLMIQMGISKYITNDK